MVVLFDAFKCPYYGGNNKNNNSHRRIFRVERKQSKHVFCELKRTVSLRQIFRVVKTQVLVLSGGPKWTKKGR